MNTVKQTKELHKMLNTIEFNGRKWFNKSEGNTYHTAEVLLNDKVIAKVTYSYGYDEMWLINALEELERVKDAHNLPAFTDNHGRKLTPRRYFEKLESHGFIVGTKCIDVQRKKDLHQ